MLIANGTYAARPTTAGVYESDKGALVLCLGLRLQDGTELKSYHTLATADGTLSTRTIENLKAWAPWDGVDPFWFVDTDLSGIDVEAVIENEDYQGRMVPKVKWVNPPGGGVAAPKSGDRSKIAAKYGAKFRAVAGGTPMRPAAPAPAPRPTAPAPAAVTSAPATMDACWSRLCELMAKAPQDKRESTWFGLVDMIGKGRGQDAFGPEDWGALLSLIESKHDDLPF